MRIENKNKGVSKIDTPFLFVFILKFLDYKKR